MMAAVNTVLARAEGAAVAATARIDAANGALARRVGEARTARARLPASPAGRALLKVEVALGLALMGAGWVLARAVRAAGEICRLVLWLLSGAFRALRKVLGIVLKVVAKVLPVLLAIAIPIAIWVVRKLFACLEEGARG